MITPVTVICTCYNHGPFVKESLESVWAQTHQPVQLIVIDNASTDNSRTVIQKAIESRPNVVFLRNTHNEGLCKAFNRGLEQATGKYKIGRASCRERVYCVV